MKKYRKIILALLLLVTFMLVGCTSAEGVKNTDSKETAIRTFADWTDCEIFQDIPVMAPKGSRIGKAADYGDETYIITVNGTSFEDYQSYLATLEENGFEKYVDNGSEGLDGCVFNSVYQKDELVLTVTHMEKTNLTYIAASEKMNLSEHLFYSDDYVTDNQPNAKNTLHLLELHTYGDSYVIQMKNGHFLVVDGGMEKDTRYLLDYMETLTPEGEKPFVEGWFITHGHDDHIGPFITFVDNQKYTERVSVEGVYFTEPSSEVCNEYNISVQNVKYATMALKNSEGKPTKFYRPQTGQRYYFNDITIDILHTQEQLLLEDYENNFNDSSSWFMFTIDGQKFLDAGDASEGGINVVKRTYNQEYFNLDLLSVFHHGQNVYKSYVDYFSYKVAIYPTFTIGSQKADYKVEENNKIQQNAVECMSWGDGTKILTFPYELGTAKSLPMREWTYNPERQKPAPFK